MHNSAAAWIHFRRSFGLCLYYLILVCVCVSLRTDTTEEHGGAAQTHQDASVANVNTHETALHSEGSATCLQSKASIKVTRLMGL